MNNKKLHDENGSLLLFNRVDKDDIDLLLTILCRGRYDYLTLLREVVKDDISLIKLFDIMAGTQVQFPERRKVYKTLEKAVIYNYCKDRDFSEDSIFIMAKQYQKRIPQVKAIINTMQNFLLSSKDSDKEDLFDDIDNMEEDDE